MLPLIDALKPASAVDIGCNVGWYSLSLAGLGISTLGVEGHPPHYRTAIYATKKSGLSNVGIAAMVIDVETVRLLPSADCTLFLAIWHHLVQTHGLDAATSILSMTWERTRKVLFFETGEAEMPPDYNLPEMLPDPRTWLMEYLSQSCRGAAVVHLGLHHAGRRGESGPWRNFFALVRDSESASGA
jgi:hypothetical protein